MMKSANDDLGGRDSGLSVGFADALAKASLEKGGRVIAQSGAAEWSIDAARGEVVGFQVIISPGEESFLLLDESNWLSPLGFRTRYRLAVQFADLPLESIQLYSVRYLEDEQGMLWPEALERTGYASLPPNRAQLVYVRIRLPQDALAGTRIGAVRLYSQSGFEDEAPCWSGTVSLHVHNVTLPPPARRRFHLNLWQHWTSLARHHRVPLWSESHFQIIERYMATLSELGQKALSLVVSEIPWSGQRCFREADYPSALYEHAVVGVKRDRAGLLHFDFRDMDRLIDLARRFSMDNQIDVFGIVNIWRDEEFGFGKIAPDAPDAIRVRYSDESDGTIRYLRSADELGRFIQALRDHFAELNLLDRVRVAADEPEEIQSFLAGVDFVRRWAPEFRYSAAVNHWEFVVQAPEGVRDFSPLLPLVTESPRVLEALRGTVHARGGRLTWYVCCVPPRPNTFLSSPLIEGVLIGWLTYHYGLDGFLRWAFCLWPADPWGLPAWRWSAGDMYFVLPGNDGAPIETLRFETLRAAGQDYELLKLVEDKLGGAGEEVIKAAIARVLHRDPAPSEDLDAPRADFYSFDPRDYREARRLLLAALESATDIIHDL